MSEREVRTLTAPPDLASAVQPPAEARAGAGAGRVLGEVSTGEIGTVASEQEHRASVERLRKGLIPGVAIWTAFALGDWVLVTYVHPGRLWVYWGLRAIGLVAALGLIRLLREPRWSTPRVVRWLDPLAFTGIALLVTLMTLEAGGLTTIYVQGIVTVLISRAIALQTHWREAAWRLGPVALCYPVIILALRPLSPTLVAQFEDRVAWGAFLVNLQFIAVAYGFIVAAGHLTWSLRMQLYATRSLGKYRLIALLGKGGMGEVWSADHLQLRKRVAIKVLRTTPGAADTAIKRFRQEMVTMAELTHPNIVRVLDAGSTQDGLLYYVMDLIEGEDLQSLVDREGRLAPERALLLGIDAAMGLRAAHERGIVHRDVKPENILIARSDDGAERAKVFDFGIAKLTDEAEDHLTRTGALVGTPLYLSPEAARGAETDERSDIYSLGCTLYVALAGVPPHQVRGAGALLFAHQNVDPPPPSEHTKAPLPAELDALVMRCLAKDPSARFATMTDLIRAMESARSALTRAASTTRGAA